jgi:hypothetical protein
VKSSPVALSSTGLRQPPSNSRVFPQKSQAKLNCFLRGSLFGMGLLDCSNSGGLKGWVKAAILVMGLPVEA